MVSILARRKIQYHKNMYYGIVLLNQKRGAMKLTEYLKKNNLSIADFAKIIDYNAAYIGQILRFEKIPGKKFVKRVEIATDGLVSGVDMIAESYENFMKKKNSKNSET